MSGKSKLEWIGAVIAGLALLGTLSAAIWSGGQAYESKAEAEYVNSVDARVRELAVEVKALAEYVSDLRDEQKALRSTMIDVLKEIR